VAAVSNMKDVGYYLCSFLQTNWANV